MRTNYLLTRARRSNDFDVINRNIAVHIVRNNFTLYHVYFHISHCCCFERKLEKKNTLELCNLQYHRKELSVKYIINHSLNIKAQILMIRVNKYLIQALIFLKLS